MGLNGEGSSAALRGWVGLCSILQATSELFMNTAVGVIGAQLGVAVAIICITNFKLSHISTFHVDVGTRSYDATGTCLLDANTGVPGVCIYAYVVAGVSIIATMVVSLFLCCTCNLCGCGPVIEFIFAGGGTAWWAIAAIYIMKKSWAADDAGVIQHNWRLTEWILCWVGCGLFLLYALLSFARMCALLCGCCGGDRNNKRYP